jgi:hypothetical protein
MHQSTPWTIVILSGAAALLAACSGQGDPLGGPYGGSSDAVSPNGGNVDAASDEADADAEAPVDDSGSGSSSGPSGSSGHSGSGSSSGKPSGSGSSTGSSSGSSSGTSSGSTSGSSSGSGSGSTASGGTTWTQVYSGYLAGGTIGNCTQCHGLQMYSASAAYSWLQGQRYINGTGSTLATSGSCLSWLGGNMPPGGPRKNAQAQAALTAWAAAGAKNN